MIDSAQSTQLVSPDDHSGPKIGEYKGVSVIACTSCKFSHTSPLPTETELEDFYRTSYYESAKPDYISNDLEDIEYWRSVFNDRLFFLSNFTAGRTLLDVGCGSGLFMRHASSAGWSCTGVEPSPAAVEYGKSIGLDMTLSTLLAYQGAPASFDVVHLKNVLEHVNDPALHLRHCHRLLKNGGVIYIEVPNDFEWLQKLAGIVTGVQNSWITWEHLNYFTPHSLVSLMQSCGYRILRRDASFPMSVFPCIGMNYIGNPAVGRRCHQLRVALELGMNRLGLGFLRRLFFRCCAALGTGRTIVIYGRKI